MSNFGLKLKNTAVNLLFPPKCIVCGAIIDASRGISEIYCVCEICRPMYESAYAELCCECNQSVSHCLCGIKIGRGEIAPLAKSFYYKPNSENAVQNKIIFSLKHTDDKRIAKYLAFSLAPSALNMLKSEGIDAEDCLFTYVPRRRAAISRDGFDQGLRLAYYTACELGVRSGFRPLLRRVGGREQKKLDGHDRQKNLERAIKIKRRAKGLISGKVICVVDDVATSGATMRAAEKLLLANGAKKVLFACVAKSRKEK